MSATPKLVDAADPVRRRPGMYVGDVDDGGIDHMVWELVANVVDLHLARSATELHVDIADDGSVTVRDDGPGIRVDRFDREGTPFLEIVFTKLHASGTLDGHAPHVHLAGGLHGVGAAAVCALSARLDVETTRDGVRWAHAFERGKPVGALRRLGDAAIDGTLVRFRPDPEIFHKSSVHRARIDKRLREMAWLNPLLRVFFQGARLPGLGGIRRWTTALAEMSGSVAAIYSTTGSSDDVVVDVALAWVGEERTDARSSTHESARTDARRPANQAFVSRSASCLPDGTIRSFVNTVETRSGTHVNGLWRGLAGVARRFRARAHGMKAVRAALEPRLTGMVHVGLHDPRFANPTKDHLDSPIAVSAVRHVIERDLPRALGYDERLRRFLEAKLGFGWTPPDRPSG